MLPPYETGLPVAEPSPMGLRRTLRFGLAPISQASQRRMVSRPILMPINPSPMARLSAELPSRARRSNSSRCGSSLAVAWLRGWRDWATAWANVSGELGASGECVGNDMVAIGSPYAWWLGGARGAPKARSKRKRLDVGVLPYCFVLFSWGESIHCFRPFISWFIRLVGFLELSFEVLVELASWSLRLFFAESGLLAVGIACRFFGPASVVGGGQC